MTLVRGRSSNPDLAKLGHLIHVAFFLLASLGLLGMRPEQEQVG